MKVWIDTDIGGDIDDAFTLLLAMASPEIKLVGVSTVFENTKLRAKIAKNLLVMGGFPDVKVYAGIGKPIKATTVHGEKVDCESKPKTYKETFDKQDYDGDNAVEMLAQNLKSGGGDINVLCIGALTNIASLIKNYPEAAEKIKHLYIMGTAVQLNVNEFNISCDPEAADIVLNSNLPKTIVCLDTTFNCSLNENHMKRLKNCKSPLLKTVMQMCDMWHFGVFLHDPLTLAVMIDPSFVVFGKGNLQVELLGDYSRGKCINLCDFNWKRTPREDMDISSKVDAKRFAKFYIDRVINFDKKLIKNKK